MTPFLSIIVPIYNVAPFIGTMIAHFKEQEFPFDKFEIILIDDGSDDNSVAIAKDQAQDLPNVRWIYQERKGVSIARNAGLEVANGMYIWFVDSDDFISDHILTALHQAVEEAQHPAILAFSGIKFFEDGHERPTVQYPEGLTSLKGVEHLASPSLFSAVHHYLFLRSFLIENELTFVPKIYHEDEEFIARALFFAPTLVRSSLIGYHYRQRQGSIMNSYNPQRGRDLFYIAQLLHSFAKQHPHPALYRRINHSLLASLAFYRSYGDHKGGTELLRSLIKDANLIEGLNHFGTYKIKLLIRLTRYLSPYVAWRIYLLAQLRSGRK